VLDNVDVFGHNADMARLSRREKLRREHIARGMRRYWKHVKRVQKVKAVPLREARALVKVLPRVYGFEKALQAYTIGEETQEEFAFNLKDRDEENGWNLPEQVRGDTQTWRVSWELYDPAHPGQSLNSGDGTITFETPGGAEKFWSNYFEACRNFLKQFPGSGSEGRLLAVHVPLKLIQHHTEF